MARDEAYPGEQVAVTELMEQTICEQFDDFRISYTGIQRGERAVCVESDAFPSTLPFETERTLEELESVLAAVGVTDVVVYCEGSYYGIVVDYQNWNGELTGDEEVLGDTKVQIELVPANCVGEESSQWLYLQLDAAELENMAVSNWYGITFYYMASEEQLMLHAQVQGWRFAYLPEAEQYEVCSYRILRDGEQERLQDAYRINSTLNVGEETECRSVSRIGPDTGFVKAVIYDVGQALCVGIFEAFSYDKGQPVQERLAAFFDFGLPYTAGRPRVRAARDYWIIRTEIMNFVNGYGLGSETRDHIHIVLSHWHLDHCILAQLLTTELAHTVWHVPCDGLGPSALRIRNHIEANGGKVEAVVGPFDALSLMGNGNLRYGKIDFGFKRHPVPAVVRASRHPHHHGMYMIVELISGSKLFLGGDCTYAGINARLKAKGFTHLQASHHGGNYALAPAARNWKDIPCPAGNGGVLICSCGPYAQQHHPNQAVLTDHSNAGWARLHVTDNSGGYTVR